MTDPVEADLIAKARAGSFSAFEEIVKRHQRRVYAVARRIVRRHDLADDVAQEAFIRAHRALGDFDLARPFGPWIGRIAANLAINRVRSPEHREEPLDDRPRAAPAAGADPLAGLLEAEAQAVLERALGELPPEQRAVFVLRVSEELSYREIAEALDISIGTVMSRLWRAREKLRGLLLPYLTEARTARGAP
jgi:RNA polymerase sigma-70 factor (ECF subfamily)